MKKLPRILAVSSLALSLCGSMAFAQDEHRDDRQAQEHQRRDDQRAQEHQQYVRHDEWRRGSHIRDEDWRRGEQVDWRARHLRHPPRGYEWRAIDGHYVLATPDGVIYSVRDAR